MQIEGYDSVMNEDIDKILFTKSELADTVQRLGKEISADYKGKHLVMVSVLKGSVMIMADLMRAITIPCEIDFMSVKSYAGAATKSTGNVQIVKDLGRDIRDCDILIVEDILDSGYTLNYIRKMIVAKGAASVKICALFDKPERRAPDVDVKADYVGAVVPDAFIVGYGLDFDEHYRNLPYVGVLKPEIYDK